MATGMEAWKIAKGLYIVPLIFAYTPLIGADFWAVVQIGLFSLFGIYAFTALIQRYSEGPIALWFYPVLIAGGAACFWPLNLVVNIIGAAAIILIIVKSGRLAKAQNNQPAS